MRLGRQKPPPGLAGYVLCYGCRRWRWPTAFGPSCRGRQSLCRECGADWNRSDAHRAAQRRYAESQRLLGTLGRD